MSRNGSGMYALPAGNPVITGTTISSTWANTTLSDIATALTGSIAADGQTPITGNQPMAGFKHTGVDDAAARTDYAQAAQVQDGSLTYLTSIGGTADIITAVAPLAMSAYAAGQAFRFIAGGTNTTNVTINVNGIGAKAITKNGANPLVARDISIGAIVEITYDGTQFQLGALPSGSLSLLSTDPGASPGPVIELYRDSASPANNDLLGALVLSGEDDGGTQVSWGSVVAQILNVSSADRESRLRLGFFSEGGTTSVLIGATSEFFNISTESISIDGNQAHPTILETEQLTTSGTAFPYTGIPDWVGEIDIIFAGVSLSGTDDILIQIGDAGGIETTGYISTCGSATAAPAVGISSSTSGFVVRCAVGSAIVSGKYTLTRLAGNQWVGSFSGKNATTTVQVGGGDKTLSDTLTQLTITRDGANTFDAGAVNVKYKR